MPLQDPSEPSGCMAGELVARDVEPLAMAVQHQKLPLNEFQRVLLNQRGRFERLVGATFPKAWREFAEVYKYLDTVTRYNLSSVEVTNVIASRTLEFTSRLRQEAETLRGLAKQVKKSKKRPSIYTLVAGGSGSYGSALSLSGSGLVGVGTTFPTGVPGASPPAKAGPPSASKDNKAKRVPPGLSAKQFLRLRAYLQTKYRGSTEHKDLCWSCSLAGRARAPGDHHSDFSCPSAADAYARIPADFSA